MAMIIDLEEARHLLSEQRKVADTHLSDEGTLGAIARSFDLHEALTLWRISESNRKSDPDDILTAIFTVFVNAIAAELQTHSCEECRDDQVKQLTEEFGNRLAHTVKTVANSPVIQAKEVGTA